VIQALRPVFSLQLSGTPEGRLGNNAQQGDGFSSFVKKDNLLSLATAATIKVTRQ
jgi:hypothetical protein